MLHDLMRPEFVTLFANLLGTDPYGGTAPSVILNNRPANAKSSAIVQAALTKVGCKYVWGSRGPDTFDCSGFVYWCLKQAGMASPAPTPCAPPPPARPNTASSAAGRSPATSSNPVISSSGRTPPAPRATAGTRSTTQGSTSATVK